MDAILFIPFLWSADAHSVSLQIQANCRTGQPIFLPFSADNIVLGDFFPTYSRVYLGVPKVAHCLSTNLPAPHGISQIPESQGVIFTWADPQEIKYPEVKFLK
jgi:hypothetical protein